MKHCPSKSSRVTHLCEKRELKSGVRFDEINQILGPKTAEKVANVRTNEAVVHNRRAIILNSGDRLQMGPIVQASRTYLE